MLHRKRAIATAILLLVTMISSVGIYLVHDQIVKREVIITSVQATVQSQGGYAGIGYYYLASSQAPITYEQGETFFVLLFVRGNETLYNISVSPEGFTPSYFYPNLPLSLHNSTEPVTMVVGVTVSRCCFDGSVTLMVDGEE